MYNTDLPTRLELPSSQRLLTSTCIAIVTAGILLVTVVLPAEYGIDPTGIGNKLGLTPMGEIKAALEAEAKADVQDKAPADLNVAASLPPATQQMETAATTPVSADSKTRFDEMDIVLKPGEATEIKMLMKKGAKVSFSWQTNGGLVNHDTHGDPLNGAKNVYHGYSKGKQVMGDRGELIAVFEGNHGWFWRNRSDKDVTIKLKTNGDYSRIKKMM